MPSGFRRVAVLGVTSLGTWAIYNVGAQADAGKPYAARQPPIQAQVTPLHPRPMVADARRLPMA